MTGAPLGISEAAAAERLLRDGPNQLPQKDRRTTLQTVWTVVREPMVLLLLFAVAIYVLLGDAREGAILAVSVGLVIALTVYQERKSENALQALRDLSSPRASVYREGHLCTVDAGTLVVGDVIAVAEGDRIPADARLIEASGIRLDESMLTGESVPVDRSAASTTDPEARVIRAGTLMVAGHGIAEVIAIGAGTAVGQIGEALRTLRSPPTPMQVEIRRAVIVFAVLGLASSVLLGAVYFLLHGGWLQSLLAGVTLAMANIPEEFPVVLTVFLALGAWRLAKHKALVRRAPAIEALGSITVLCTDKTGTLTENRMTVAELFAENGDVWPGTATAPVVELLKCARRACAQPPLDPMDRAIGASDDALLPHGTAALRHPVRDYGLTPELTAVTRVWADEGGATYTVSCKGAPETVARLCAMDEAQRSAVLARVEAMARRGLRVLAAAEATWPADAPLPDDVRDFPFAWRGLLGFEDPLRAGVPAAVAEAQAAGIRVVMLTGDHPETARAIAAQAGIANAENVLLGSALSADDAAVTDLLRNTQVFARVKPAHKLRLIEALKRDGQVVAMTGDGVNDAPALTAAHVGVAMGQRGTDVAREAASIVLLDDDFVTVVRAIRQGRVIYDNITRAIRYILAVHVPITGLALLPLLTGGSLILFPLHIVFLELIIDPASTLVFEREPAAADVMRRPPRPPNRRLLDARMLLGSLGQGFAAFLAVVAIYSLGRTQHLPANQLSALCFTALVVGNLGLIVANRAAHAQRDGWGIRNPVFWMVSIAAISLLVLVTRFESAGLPFRFAPPPLQLSGVAVVLPIAALFLVGGVRRALHH